MPYKIYIDQGHNPRNPNAGAEGNGYYEQDLTYEIGRLTAELLAADPNFDVLLSRKTSDEILGTGIASSLAARTNEANAWGANFFISLHANASTISSASGSEAYAYSRQSPGWAMGDNILFWMNRSTGLPNRGVFIRPSLWVLRRSEMPSVLIEMGFITNKGDADLMANQPGLFATGIYNGIQQFYGYLRP